MKPLIAILVIVPFLASAAPFGDFQSNSPSFSGVGYSSHVLTVENQERTRQKEREDRIQAAIEKEASDKKNTNLYKFISNLESRIYAQISQNVATAMFKNNSCTLQEGSVCSGSIDFQGNMISWSRTNNAQDASCSAAMNNCLVLKIADPTVSNPNAACGSGGPTCIYVPLESFTMPGN